MMLVLTAWNISMVSFIVYFHCNDDVIIKRIMLLAGNA